MWHAQYKKTQKREAKCEPGQTVYVCMGKKGQLTKLQPLFDGPYTVVSDLKIKWLFENQRVEGLERYIRTT